MYPEVRNSQFQIDLVFTDERPENIRTGQTYYINLQLGQPEQSMLVSLGGFFNSTGGQWIYVVDPSGDFATKRNIRIGRKNPKYYEVLEGLEEGEKVITSGYDLFGENDKYFKIKESLPLPLRRGEKERSLTLALSQVGGIRTRMNL